MGSEGLVDVNGKTVGIGRKSGVHWVIKVVEAMVGPQRGEHTSNTRGTLLEKTTQIERVSGRFLICSM